jgi:transposase
MKCVPPLRAPAIHTWTDMQRVPPSRRARLRAHGILLSHQGFSMSRIAAVSQVARYAVSAGSDRGQRAGRVGLYDQPRPGRPLRLTTEEQQKVEQSLQEHPKEWQQGVHLLAQEPHKRGSTTTMQRRIKKNAPSGNGADPPPQNPLRLPNLSVPKHSLPLYKHEKALATVLCGMSMPADVVGNRVCRMPGNPEGPPWHCRKRHTTSGCMSWGAQT